MVGRRCTHSKPWPHLPFLEVEKQVAHSRHARRGHAPSVGEHCAQGCAPVVAESHGGGHCRSGGRAFQCGKPAGTHCRGEGASGGGLLCRGSGSRCHDAGRRPGSRGGAGGAGSPSCHWWRKPGCRARLADGGAEPPAEVALHRPIARGAVLQVGAVCWCIAAGRPRFQHQRPTPESLLTPVCRSAVDGGPSATFRPLPTLSCVLQMHARAERGGGARLPARR